MSKIGYFGIRLVVAYDFNYRCLGTGMPIDGSAGTDRFDLFAFFWKLPSC